MFLAAELLATTVLFMTDSSSAKAQLLGQTALSCFPNRIILFFVPTACLAGGLVCRVAREHGHWLCRMWIGGNSSFFV